MMIRPYCNKDEVGWVRCRTLAFLDTAYYENVLNKKEKYENPTIELVAELNGLIVGLIDVEYEVTERTVCSRGTGDRTRWYDLAYRSTSRLSSPRDW